MWSWKVCLSEKNSLRATTYVISLLNLNISFTPLSHFLHSLSHFPRHSLRHPLSLSPSPSAVTLSVALCRHSLRRPSYTTVPRHFSSPPPPSHFAKALFSHHHRPFSTAGLSLRRPFSTAGKPHNSSPPPLFSHKQVRFFLLFHHCFGF